MIGIAAITLMAAGCGKESVTPQESMEAALVGEWHLAQTEVDGTVLDTQSDVYLAINSDCTFELYQKSGDMLRYTKFTGSCSLKGNKLSGTYSDGTPWGSIYTAEVDGAVLILTNETQNEVQKYNKEAISEEIKDEADVKSNAYTYDVEPIL